MGGTRILIEDPCPFRLPVIWVRLLSGILCFTCFEFWDTSIKPRKCILYPQGLLLQPCSNVHVIDIHDVTCTLVPQNRQPSPACMIHNNIAPQTIFSSCRNQKGTASTPPTYKIWDLPPRSSNSDAESAKPWV